MGILDSGNYKNVSRQTYHSWIAGHQINPKNAKRFSLVVEDLGKIEEAPKYSRHIRAIFTQLEASLKLSTEK